MVGLLDLAPSTKVVKVGGKDIPVGGVTAKGIAALLQQFPSLQNALQGGGLNLKGDALFEFAPDAIAAIIAAGCGYPGDTEQIAAAEKLNVGDQLALLDATLAMTMPQGAGPFVDALTATMDRLSFENRGKAPASKSASQSKT